MTIGCPDRVDSEASTEDGEGVAVSDTAGKSSVLANGPSKGGIVIASAAEADGVVNVCGGASGITVGTGNEGLVAVALSFVFGEGWCTRGSERYEEHGGDCREGGGGGVAGIARGCFHGLDDRQCGHSEEVQPKAAP